MTSAPFPLNQIPLEHLPEAVTVGGLVLGFLINLVAAGWISHNRRPSVALAWLLKKSPVMLPIPGTSKVKHLEQNTAAATLELNDELMAELEQAKG